MNFPIRINKYLAEEGYSTRRGADALIQAGKVLINGRKAVLGDKVNEGDTVKVDAKAVAAKKKSYVYYAYNKPVGIVTHSPQKGEQAIADVVKLPGVFPLGRLDKESHGLLLLTNDGRMTDRLLNPEAEHEKEYIVKVDKPLKQNTITRLGKGIKIDGDFKGGSYITKPAIAEEISSYSLRLIITEGKRHQIRRMLTALGYQVVDLKRVRVMNIELGDLKEGQHRELTATEKSKLLKDLGL
jgi:23S rRNA pseudouridine2604 synthase